MSTAAAQCPSCGQPNKRIANRKQDRLQGAGCLLMMLGVPALIVPVAGVSMLAVGFVIAVVNTRLR